MFIFFGLCIGQLFAMLETIDIFPDISYMTYAWGIFVVSLLVQFYRWYLYKDISK